MAGKAASFLTGVRQIDAKGNIVGEVCAPSPPLCLSAHVPQTTPGSSVCYASECHAEKII